MLLALPLPCLLSSCTKLLRPRVAARNPGKGEIIGTSAAGVKKGFRERHQLEGVRGLGLPGYGCQAQPDLHVGSRKDSENDPDWREVWGLAES